MKKRLKTLKTCWAQERLVLPQAQIMALKTATAKRQAAGEIETLPARVSWQSRHLFGRYNEGCAAHIPANIRGDLLPLGLGKAVR